jgi:MEMO1 family protein
MADEVIFAGIVPHPPLLVPDVGGPRLTEFSRRLVQSNPDTVVLISPHSPSHPHKFGAFKSERLIGDFRQFGARKVELSFPNDLALLASLKGVTRERSIPFEQFTADYPLDHGTLVPLYFIKQAGWEGPLLALSFTSLSRAEHFEFGRACSEAAARLGRKIAFVASADLSHYLSDDGPYRFVPGAYLFDEQVCRGIDNQDLQSILEIDEALQMRAGECGYRSILVAIGAVNAGSPKPKLLSYESPFGVGYPVAILKEKGV